MEALNFHHEKKKSTLFQELSALTSEHSNPNTSHIDELSAYKIATLINNEDKIVAKAIEKILPDIGKAIDLVHRCFQRGGRLIYVGSGTSGRLGILDASECPPTFGVPATLVQGIIAGGKRALYKSVESIEDNRQGAIPELEKLKFNSKDVLCGISASHRTPFVLGALAFAKSCRASTLLLSVNSKKTKEADIILSPHVGAEVIMGSTRMKSGTAQKMMLNMITTGAMVLYGKTYGNMMIDIKPVNKKLEERAKRIFMSLTKKDYTEASHFLEKARGNLKVGLGMYMTKLSYQETVKNLRICNGSLKEMIKNQSHTKTQRNGLKL